MRARDVSGWYPHRCRVDCTHLIHAHRTAIQPALGQTQKLRFIAGMERRDRIGERGRYFVRNGARFRFDQFSVVTGERMRNRDEWQRPLPQYLRFGAR